MTDRELWAVAHHTLERHGEEGGRAFIAERIRDLAWKGDAAGVDAWERIAACFEKLLPPRDGSPPQ